MFLKRQVVEDMEHEHQRPLREGVQNYKATRLRPALKRIEAMGIVWAYVQTDSDETVEAAAVAVLEEFR